MDVKSKLIMVGLMVVVALFLLACSPQMPHKSLVEQVSCDDFMSQKNVASEITISDYENYGQVALTIILCSNPTTGFSWSENAQISDTSILKQVSHEFIGPESEPPPPPGTPGQEIWTFEALKAGTSSISLEYSRPWEGGEKGEWTYTLTVTVK
jgi:inhibitor of cysteine peptidase